MGRRCKQHTCRLGQLPEYADYHLHGVKASWPSSVLGSLSTYCVQQQPKWTPEAQVQFSLPRHSKVKPSEAFTNVTTLPQKELTEWPELKSAWPRATKRSCGPLQKEFPEPPSQRKNKKHIRSWGSSLVMTVGVHFCNSLACIEREHFFSLQSGCGHSVAWA